MQLVMGVDIGTSSVKVVVCNWRKGLIAKSVQSYSVLSPRPQCAEQDPLEWLKATLTAIQKIDRDLLKNVEAVAFSGQMHAVVVTDEKFTPLYNALLWFDSRAQKQASSIAQLMKTTGDMKYQNVVPDSTLPLSKIKWLREEAELDWSRARYVLGAKDWLRCQFGGTSKTDRSEASGTQLLDVGGDWDPFLINAAGIDSQYLPRIHNATSIDGSLNENIAKQTGLRRGCPLIIGGGDFSTAVGLFQLTSRDLIVNIGTSGQVARRTERPYSRRGRTYFSAVASSQWHELIPLLSVGMSMAWWKRIVGEEFEGDWTDSEVRANVSPLLFLPQIAGERPWHTLPLHAGSFLGLRAEHNREDLSFAVKQGVAMSILEACEALSDNLGEANRIFLTGSAEFSRSMAIELSSALGHALTVRHFPEPTGQGAAFLALVGIGLAPQEGDDPPGHWSQETTVAPNEGKNKQYQELYPLYLQARYLQSQLWQLTMQGANVP